MRDVEDDNYGIKIGGQIISNLRYADDTVILADNHEDICLLWNKHQ